MTDLTRAKSFVNKLEIIRMKPDELAHYGVLGMKWGRRKDRAGSSSRTPKEPRRVNFKNSKTGETTKKKYPRKASTDHVESRELLRKKRPELSNQDIQKIVDRLQKEKKLKDIKPGAVNRGKKITIGVVATLGTATTLYNFANSPLGKQSIKKGATVVNAVLKRVR